MYGAILGDIIGSPYEFDMGNKSKDFPLFSKNSTYTDDTVMTIAVADAFLDTPEDEEGIRQRLIESMQRFGRLFPRAGYGGMFRRWLRSDNRRLRRKVLRLAREQGAPALRQLRKRLRYAGFLCCMAI